MGFQRAQWKSGLTYQQVCQTCKNAVRYTDDFLDYRPWYPDGYVDCPVCKSHLRHNEDYAIDRPQSSTYVLMDTDAPTVAECTDTYCVKCGNKFQTNHRFCSRCGAKRN